MRDATTETTSRQNTDKYTGRAKNVTTSHHPPHHRTITSDTAHTHYNCLHTPHSYRTLHLLHECCIKIHI